MKSKRLLILFIIILLSLGLVSLAMAAANTKGALQGNPPAQSEVKDDVEETKQELEDETPALATKSGLNHIPPGWSVIDNIGTGMEWNSNDIFGVVNRTTDVGGTGLSMAAEAYTSGEAWDTDLWSPSFDLSASTVVTVEYASNFQDFAGNGDSYLDISTDGGSSWTNIHAQSTDEPSGGIYRVFDISSYAGNNDVMLRWVYTATSSTAWYWHIDNVWVYDEAETVLFEDFEPPPAPDLSESYKIAPEFQSPSDPITYTLVVTNVGNLDAFDTVLTDVIPLGTSYITDTLGCSSGTCYEDGTAVYWSGEVLVGTPVYVEFAVEINDYMCGTSIENTATISDLMIPEPVEISAQTFIWESMLLFEDFEGVTFPPAGWTVVDNVGSGEPGSVFTNTNPGGRGNLTGGSGLFAVVDDDEAGSGVDVDTELWLPPLDIPVCSENQLIFKTDYNNISSNESADVDYSLDGGTTWVNMLHWNTDVRGPHTEAIPLPPELSGQSGVIFRFHYNDGGSWAWWWEIDDVLVTGCMKEGVLLEPDYQSMTSLPGDVVSYTLSLENCTMVTDTFNLDVTTLDFPTWLEPASIVDLPYGDTADVTSYVQSWCEADDGTADLATITALGESTGMFDTANIETMISSATIGDSWELMAPMPEGRVFQAVVGTDNYIYVIGGTSDAGGTIPTNTNFRYDIAADMWDTMEPMPASLESINGAAIGDKIYIPGGDLDDNTYVYDIPSDTWSLIPASGTFEWGIQYAVAVDGDTLYRLGGLIDDGGGGLISTNQVWALDTVAETWTELPPMLSDRTSFSAGVIDGNIYVAGGVHFPGFTPEMTSEMFDGSTWMNVAPVPDGGGDYTRWSYNADATAANKLWLMAGRRDASWDVLNHTGYYDPASDAWVTSPDLPLLNEGRVYLQGAFGGGYLFAMGGRNAAGSAIYDTNERLALSTYQAPDPELVLDVPVLEQMLPEGVTNSQIMNFSNGSTCPVRWELFEMPGSMNLEVAPKINLAPPATLPLENPGFDLSTPSDASSTISANPDAVLWDQPSDGLSAVIDQFFPDFGAGVFSADDFSPIETWGVEGIFVDGEKGSTAVGSLPEAESLHWFIFPDNGGVPDGYPGAGGEVWHLMALPSDPWVTITGEDMDEVYLDIVMATGSRLVLPPGDYWLAFYPSLSFTEYGQWFWDTAGTTNGSTAQLIDPFDLLGAGWTDWNPWTVIDPGYNDAAFRFEGRVLYDVPWLDENPLNGLLLTGEATDVSVLYDSTGLASGDYFADLLVESNDADMPSVTLPVTLTVAWPAIELNKTVGLDPNACADTDTISVPVGTEVTYCFEVTNTGEDMLPFHDLVDSELGVILDNFAYDLEVGESVFITQTVSVMADTVNTAIWTASINEFLVVEASDSATVTVFVPEPEGFMIYLPLGLKEYSPTE